MQPKINPECLPLIEWWEKDGKQYVAGLLIAAVAVGGWQWWKHHRAAAAEEASSAVATAITTDELEEAVSRHSGSSSSGVLRIRLAKSYFDAGRYEEALSAYEDLAKDAPDGFADIPVVGRAQCLEALGRFDDALKAFESFVDAIRKSAGNDEIVKARIDAAEDVIKRFGIVAAPAPAVEEKKSAAKSETKVEDKSAVKPEAKAEKKSEPTKK